MSNLKSDEFVSDPRIQKARELVLEALSDHQAKLTRIADADPDTADHYDALIDQFKQARGNPLFYPYIGSGFGNGTLVELKDGSVKYDMISGIGVHIMGHSNKQLLASSFDAMLGDTIMQGNLQQNAESLELMQRFIRLAAKNGAKIEHCFLSTSGATANENALKIAMQKNAPASRVLAFEHCFMGRTLALASLTDKDAYRVGLPKTVDVDYIPFYDANDHLGSIRRAVKALETCIQRYPKKHALMCFEKIQGEGGYYPGHHDFFYALMMILKQHHIAVFVDEIQSFGRTENAFAFQTFKLDKFIDILCVGKMTQVCATLFVDEYQWKPGLISQTFTGATASIYAANTILAELENGDYFGEHGRNMQIAQVFASEFDAMNERHPGMISGPYGYGIMIAFTAYDGSLDMTKKAIHALYKNGVIAFVAGKDPYRMRFLPSAAVITDDDIKNVCEILERTLLDIHEEANKED